MNKPKTTLESIISDRKRKSVARTITRPGSEKLSAQRPFKVTKLT